MANTTSPKVSEHDFRKAKDKAYEAREAASEAVSEAVHEAKEQLSDIEKVVTNYVKKHPIKTIGFSLLAGVIVAQILQLRK